jgi:hypothetical protein
LQNSLCGPQNVILAVVLVFQLEIYSQHPGSVNRREHQRKQSTGGVFSSSVHGYLVRPLCIIVFQIHPCLCITDGKETCVSGVAGVTIAVLSAAYITPAVERCSTGILGCGERRKPHIHIANVVLTSEFSVTAASKPL